MFSGDVERDQWHEMGEHALTLFFPEFPFDLPENIRKPNISQPLIGTGTCAYQGVRNVKFSDVFRGIKKERWVEKG